MFPLAGRMSTPSNTDRALDQFNQVKRFVFQHWKKINDELRWLRVELTSIPIYHPKCAVISLQIENLKLKKKKYNDTLQMPSYSLVAKPVPIPKHFPPVSSANTSHLKSLDSTLHWSDYSNPDENNILTQLLNIDNQTILCQLNHYVKELETDCKGGKMFLCHVIYHDDASITKSTSITDPPPLVDICDYISGQVYYPKKL